MATVWGALTVVLAGLVQGSGVWPMKLLRKYKFEHLWFLAMLVGLVIAPWVITLTLCPEQWQAYHEIGTSTLLKANSFALAWGVADVLCGLCFVRIGVALTGGILTGLGVSVGVTLPMIIKGSGLFSGAPKLGSPAGKAVLVGVAVMLVGVVLAAFAGFGRDRILRSTDQPRSGSFVGGLIMVVIAGALSAGISFAFVYNQGPIVSAMKAHGAGDIPANFAVWAIGLLGGALINVTYPIYLMTKSGSWGVLNAMGELFIGQLAWTGGYSFDFDLDPEMEKFPGLDAAAALTFSAGPDAPAPLRMIAPGETVTTPEMHLGLVFGDLDNAVQAMHTHLRRSVFLPQARGRAAWVESGIGPGQNHD